MSQLVQLEGEHNVQSWRGAFKKIFFTNVMQLDKYGNFGEWLVKVAKARFALKLCVHTFTFDDHDDDDDDDNDDEHYPI